MTDRLDFSIRNPIPSKGSHLQLDCVISAHFGKDRAVMGGSNHGGAIVMMTDALERETDYLLRCGIENNYPEVPFLLEVFDESGTSIFAQSVKIKKDKLNFLMHLPAGEKGILRLVISYDHDAEAFRNMPEVLAGGDFIFISVTIEAL